MFNFLELILNLFYNARGIIVRPALRLILLRLKLQRSDSITENFLNESIFLSDQTEEMLRSLLNDNSMVAYHSCILKILRLNSRGNNDLTSLEEESKIYEEDKKKHCFLKRAKTLRKNLRNRAKDS